MKELQSLNIPVIDHTQLVKYAGASGDFNPIHTVVPIAEEVGLTGVIAHGMLIMGFAGQAISRWFPPKNLKSFKVRFRAMTYPGENLLVEGKILEETEEFGIGLLLGEVQVKNELGKIKLIGQFEVIKDNKNNKKGKAAD